VEAEDQGVNDFARYPSLEGRVVFITGGSSGNRPQNGNR